MKKSFKITLEREGWPPIIISARDGMSTGLLDMAHIEMNKQATNNVVGGGISIYLISEKENTPVLSFTATASF